MMEHTPFPICLGLFLSSILPETGFCSLHPHKGKQSLKSSAHDDNIDASADDPGHSLDHVYIFFFIVCLSGPEVLIWEIKRDLAEPRSDRSLALAARRQPDVALKTHLSNFSIILSSRRAKRAGWPKGLKGPVGAFRPFGPASVLRRRLLHRNGNFVPLAP